MLNPLNLLPTGWQKEWNRISFVAAIHSKVAIYCNNHVLWIQLTHSDYAQIGKIRISVFIAVSQLFDPLDIFLEVKGKPE